MLIFLTGVKVRAKMSSQVLTSLQNRYTEKALKKMD